MKYKIYLFYILFFGVTKYGIAQIPTFNFRTSFNTAEATTFTAILPTDSCYYATGIIMDELPPHFPGNFFAKFDLRGKLTALSITKDSLRTLESWRMPILAVDSTFWIGGYSSDHSNHNDIKRSAFLMKYSKNGKILDKKFYDSSYAPDEPNIALQEVVRHLNGNLTMMATIGRHGQTEYFKNAELLRLDVEGNVIWRKLFGDETAEWSKSLKLLPNGNVMISIAKNIEHCQVLTLNEAGEVIDEHLSPKALGKLWGCELLPTSDGGLVIGAGQDNREPNLPIARFNEYVYKLDSKGKVLWTYRFNEAHPFSQQYTVDMVEATDGSGYVGCNYGENFPNEAGQFYDILGSVWKLSPSGELLWRRSYKVVETKNSSHNFDDLASTPDGGYILCGYSQEDYTPGVEMPRGRGWLLKLDEHGCLIPGCHITVATNDPKANEIGLRLFPNPLQKGTQLAVQVTGASGRGQFRIFDVLGRQLNLSDVEGPDGTTYFLPTTQLDSGTYFLHYQTKKYISISAFTVIAE